MMRTRGPLLLLSVMLTASAVATGCAADELEASASEAPLTELNLRVSKQSFVGPEDEEDRYLLNVTLGQITESQFEKLHAEFATKSPEGYDSQRSYELVDFLPPFARKANGNILLPHSVAADDVLLSSLRAQDKPTDGQAYVDANCHSVTWQWVNHVQGHGSDEAVLTLMDGEALFEATSSFQTVRVDQGQASDIFFVKGNGGFHQIDAILHSGVYLGRGLVFEKANPGENYPYRIAYLKDVMAKYKRVDPNAQFSFRRITPSEVLNTPQEELSLASKNIQAAFSLDLRDVSPEILAQYQLQETWEGDGSVFTLGSLMATSQVSADKFHPVKAPERH